MWWKKDPEALVVGAGPVGLAVASRMARRGLQVRILDKQWGPAGHSYALALHAATVEALGEMGLEEELLRRAHPISELCVFEKEQMVARVDLPSPLLVLPQRALEEILEEDLRRHGIEVAWNRRVSRVALPDDRPLVTVERLEKDSMGYPIATTGWVVHSVGRLRPRFVVGADGSGSVVRRDAKISLDVAGDLETFAVFELAASGVNERQAVIAFHGETVNVLWPMGDGRLRWSFQLLPPDPSLLPRVKARRTTGEDRHEVPLSEATFRKLVRHRAPWFSEDLGEIFWSTAVSFEQHVARRFGQGPLWLAGDAAHGASPVGSHSMNGGIREGLELADLLARVALGDASPEVLETWNRERCLEWRQLLGMDGSGRLLPSAGAWLEACAPALPGLVPASGRDLESLLGRLGLEWHTQRPALQEVLP
jgi:2-polyprenyl-6-methoxyphenol hydroxylase-like FAD-dependent oxidoreductase